MPNDRNEAKKQQSEQTDQTGQQSGSQRTRWDSVQRHQRQNKAKKQRGIESITGKGGHHV